MIKITSTNIEIITTELTDKVLNKFKLCNPVDILSSSV